MVIDIKQLPGSGSNRIYYRVFYADDTTVIAAFNHDVSENIAWYSFSQHFRNKGLAIPEIYFKDDNYRCFLLEDLGDSNLFDLLKEGLTSQVKDYYKQAISDLTRFQISGIIGLDLDVAYPVESFDRKSILWDLNYFKYYFVKPHELTFNESRLEHDFQKLSDLLLEPKSDFFQYRDFQTRNIIIRNNQLYYIDFQGGRRGPLQYDLVSLLYQAKANLPEDFRSELFNFYLDEIEKIIPDNREAFIKYFHYFVYFRLMQVLGAYGFRGLIQRKGHFLNSIPFAINNLKQLLQQYTVEVEFPELFKIFDQIIRLDQYDPAETSPDKLTVSINSFSYKKSGYPVDRTENGGGFAFDCRALPNPGRILELRNFTGLDKSVIEYLKNKKQVKQFLDNVFKIVDQTIENYLDREFDNLQVNFGCTGGQHRSVYCAEQLNSYLAKYGDDITIIAKHHEINQ